MASRDEIKQAIALATEANDEYAVVELEGMLQQLDENNAINAVANTQNVKDARAITNEALTGDTMSELRAFSRGFGQELSFGFADEVAGIADSALETLKGNVGSLDELQAEYVKGRDEARAINKQAQEQQDSSYGYGEIAGMIAPIAGALLTGGASLGASVAKQGFKETVKQSAKIGALSGAGYGFGTSEGDLSDQAVNALYGGTIGGAMGGVLGGVTGAYNAGRNALAKKRVPMAGQAIGSRELNKKIAREMNVDGKISKSTRAMIDRADEIGATKNIEGAHQAIDPIKKKVGKELGEMRKDYEPILSQYDSMTHKELLEELAYKDVVGKSDKRANKRFIENIADELGEGTGKNKIYSGDDVKQIYSLAENESGRFSKSILAQDSKKADRLNKMANRGRALETANIEKAIADGKLPKDAGTALRAKSKEYGEVATQQRVLGKAGEESRYSDMSGAQHVPTPWDVRNPTTAIGVKVLGNTVRNLTYPLAKMAEKRGKPMRVLEAMSRAGEMTTTQGILRALSSGEKVD